MYRNTCKNAPWLSSSFQTGGSAPSIPVGTSDDRPNRPFSFKPYPMVPWNPTPRSAQSGYSPLSTSGANSAPKKSRKPAPDPVVRIGVARAASAENRNRVFPWAPSNSPRLGPSANPLKSPIKPPTSSELSLCSSAANSTGSFVPNYDQQPLDINIPKGQPHAIALYDFDTRVDGDLQFRTGDPILLEEVVDDAWYRGRSTVTGQVGIFPMNHVEVRIPLEAGSYTETQPKSSLVVPPMTNGSRTGSVPSDTRWTGNQDTLASENDQPSPSTALPKRPSRIRIPSSNSKFGTPPTLTEPDESGTDKLLTRESNHGLPNPASTTNHTKSTQPKVKPAHQDLSEADSAKDDPSRIIRSSTPTSANSLRPRSQLSVFQLVEYLEQQGVTLTHTKPMPPGARAIFPSLTNVLGSSAPTPHSIDKPPNTETETEGSKKSMAFPTSQMVETPLVRVAREKQPKPVEETELKNNVTNRTTEQVNSIDQSHNGKHLTNGNEVRRSLTQMSVSNPELFGQNKSKQNTNTLISTARLQLKGKSVLIKPELSRQATLIKQGSDLSVNQANDASHPESKQDMTPAASEACFNDGQRAVVEQKTEPVQSLITHQQPSYLSSINLLGTRSSSDSDPQGQANGINGDTRVKTAAGTNPDGEKSPPWTAHSKRSSKVVRAVQATATDDPIPNRHSTRLLTNQWLLVLYDYTGTEPGDLTVKAGNVIRCLDPLPAPSSRYDVSLPESWLHCITWFNVEGQVPSTFARRISDPDELERWMKYRPRAEAVFEFKAEAPGDLSLNVGDVVYLFDSVDANWFRGENSATGERGIFPVSFVHVLCPL